MLIDTHAHLDFAQFHRRHDEVIQRAHKARVNKIINVGTTLQGSRDSVGLANKYPGIYASVGIHPHDVLSVDRTSMADILDLAKDDKVVAIGEIGLDYFGKDFNKEAQRKEFIIQIVLAKRLGLPIIIHNRKADEDILEILKVQEYSKGVIHCFSSSWQVAHKFLDLGFYISFTGSITFGIKKQKDQSRGCSPSGAILEVIKNTPLDKILIETDCPFLAPEPYRGKTNEPAYVVEVAKKIAEIRNISLEEVARKTTKNAERLFKLSN